MEWAEVGTCRGEFQQEGLDGLGVQQQLLTASLPNLAAPVPRLHNLGLLMAVQAIFRVQGLGLNPNSSCHDA